jgi:hypothetical protein
MEQEVVNWLFYSNVFGAIAFLVGAIGCWFAGVAIAKDDIMGPLCMMPFAACLCCVLAMSLDVRDALKAYVAPNIVYNEWVKDGGEVPEVDVYAEEDGGEAARGER